MSGPRATPSVYLDVTPVPLTSPAVARRLSAIPLLLALVLGACGAPVGEVEETTSTDTTRADAIQPANPSTAPGPATSDSEPGTTTTRSDRPIAPDFTLELGEGGTYTLSEGEKPVYLVFWAEW